MNKEIATIEDVKEWVKELVPFANVKEYVCDRKCQPEDKKSEKTWRFAIFTDTNKYHISAVEREDTKGYLGCTTSLRKELPGEGWHRGSDLPDGDLTRKTWDSIVRRITQHELVKLSPYILQEKKGIPMYNTDEVPIAEEPK